MNHMLNIQPFIFNWPGQTDKAVATEKAINAAGYRTTVINSDPNYTPFNWINLGNDAYFSEQWSMAMKLFRGDIMFHIQADATYDNWSALINDAERYFEKYHWGIYSPRFQDNGHYIPLETWQCEDQNIKAIPNPDCTCWFLHKDIIDKFRNLNLNVKVNHLGWGIDCVMCAISWSSGRIVLRDFGHEVFHAPGRGYSSEEAVTQMNKMFEQLSPELMNAVLQQYNNRESLLEYLEK